MTPSLVTLPICCMCKRVSEDESRASALWMKLPQYLKRRHVNGSDLRLTHTYCPACFGRQAREWHLHDLAS